MHIGLNANAFQNTNQEINDRTFSKRPRVNYEISPVPRRCPPMQRVNMGSRVF